MENINLYDWGLNKSILKEQQKEYPKYKIGRVVEEQRNLYKVITEKGKMLGKVSGKLLYHAKNRADYPAVGDWVVIGDMDHKSKTSIIEGILSRKSIFSRKMAGKQKDEQIIAANIDTLFICMALNSDYNLKRLERYISLAWNSGATPVVLLMKSDLCNELEDKIKAVENTALGIEVIAVSTYSKLGLGEVKRHLKYGETIGLVGSSGVGKSTLINNILGYEKQHTNEIRRDDKGKHTTTYREVLLIPSGGIVIDTPGMREIHLLDDVESVESSFLDIEELSKGCRFSNCTHLTEPGCAVIEAIEEGDLTEERYENFLKLKREAEYMERKGNKKAQSDYNKMLAKRHKSVKKSIK